MSEATEADQEEGRKITSHFPLLLAVLIAASIWIYVFTSWFPIFGSILGLGGVLMVVPALQGLMGEERRRAYAAWIDDLLFQKQVSAQVYIVLLLAGLFFGFVVFQPFTLTNQLLDKTLPVQVGFSANASALPPTKRALIAPGKSFSLPIAQPLFGGAKFVWVSSPGYPQIRKKVNGFGWPSMSLPQDLWQQPVLLMRPSPALLPKLEETLPKFSITINGW